MAFSDYEHCHYCVADKQAGRPLPDEHGYKGLYVGDTDVPNHINVICSHHLKTLQDEIATLCEREAHHLARIAELEAKAANLDARLWDRCEDLARVGLERCHADAVSRDREAQHLARIADLEEFQSQWQQRDGNTPGYNLQKAKNYGAQAYEWKQKAIELAAREAQHLADIKALRTALASVCIDILTSPSVTDTMWSHRSGLSTTNDYIASVLGIDTVDECERRTSQAAIEAQDERDTLRARVVELEGQYSRRVQSHTEDLKEAHAREAQHLADIKALRAPSRLPFDYGVQAAAYDKAIAATAHYDDAKAAEGGEG